MNFLATCLAMKAKKEKSLKGRHKKREEKINEWVSASQTDELERKFKVSKCSENQVKKIVPDDSVAGFQERMVWTRTNAMSN